MDEFLGLYKEGGPAKIVTALDKLEAPFRGGDHMATLTQPGDHMATLAQPGFVMWFNMDAPDDVLRKGFEYVLKAARSRWPSPIKQRGRGTASPRITETTLGTWWRRKIIPLLDLDWHFTVDDPDARPTDILLGRWLYGDREGQPAREVNKARTLLREAMVQRAALHHTLRFPGISADKTGK
jgi:hypothetical protein